MPDIHLVRGIHTIYFGGRRLFSKDIGAFNDEKLNAFVLSHPKSTDLASSLVAKDLLSEPAANFLGWAFSPLIPTRRFIGNFFLMVTTAVLLCIAANQAFRPMVNRSIMSDGLVFQIVSFIVIVCWHEIGHMAAARRFGIRVDSGGIGAYFIVPALFTRISMIALLSRRERICVMLAGVYFQAYLGIVLALLYLWFGDPVILRLINSNVLIACLNLIPFLRLDGHHVAVEAMALMNERGRLHGVQHGYDLINRGFTAVSIAYVAYILVNAFQAVRDGGSSSEIAYFAFVAIVSGVMVYRLMRMTVARCLAFRRGTSVEPI